MTRDDIELLAPVGSRESLAAALKAGADAIYFGAGGLNMRSRSSAVFGLDDLREIASSAAEKGARSYLTLNVVLYDDDLARMRLITDTAKAAGVSALIVGDIAAMEYARSVGMETHLSTQANVSNIEALRFYARWADTVVLARELSLERVAAISRAIREQDIRGPSGALVRIELFAHGALCMAVSGKCYLSLHRYGASANRGECNQNCRRSYILKDATDGHEILTEENYFLSPKDLKTIGFLDQALTAGVRSLKIEGRARSADYVRTTVECYSEAIDAVLDGSYGPERIAEWDARLSEVFNRGFWDGWYLGAQVSELTDSYGSKATVKKSLIGVCLNYFSKMGAAEFILEAGSLSRGDRFLVTGPTSGAIESIAEQIRVDEQCVEQACKGSRFTVGVPEKVRKGDKLYRLEQISKLG
ncbi:MAG: peptidase U32 family protein [Treponemataceae bacterium]